LKIAIFCAVGSALSCSPLDRFAGLFGGEIIEAYGCGWGSDGYTPTIIVALA
jgi:hypothetical protein